MKITQVSIFLENRQGRLYEVCDLFGENDINILALTVAETENFGIVRTVVNEPDQAMQLLKQEGFAAKFTDVVVVEIEDKPGGLASVLKVFNDNNLNVEYMHTFFSKAKQGDAYMVFRFENPEEAINVLKENNITPVQEKDLQEI